MDQLITPCLRRRFGRRRLMQLGDLDEALLFLASNSARATTRAIITVDDGQTL